ncbi:Mitochondrial division protein 1 [Smittium culicis]|uniref:Mitochondrial division protein 1 n=1 Tax=Smittium culicis TaxID=133412 RepID=A0A1R1XQ07_9FUNG|nr:Mitochondrial division protein 1 [Smittium culicis]
MAGTSQPNNINSSHNTPPDFRTSPHTNSIYISSNPTSNDDFSVTSSSSSSVSSSNITRKKRNKKKPLNTSSNHSLTTAKNPHTSKNSLISNTAILNNSTSSNPITRLNAYLASLISPILRSTLASKKSKRITADFSRPSNDTFSRLQNINLAQLVAENNPSPVKNNSLYQHFSANLPTSSTNQLPIHPSHPPNSTAQPLYFSNKQVSKNSLFNQTIGWSQLTKPSDSKLLQIKANYSNLFQAQTSSDSSPHPEQLLMHQRDNIIQNIHNFNLNKQQLLDKIALIDSQIDQLISDKDSIEKELALIWQQGYDSSNDSTPIDDILPNNPLSLQPISNLSGFHYSGISALDFNQNNDLIALGSLDTIVSVWHAPSSSKLFSINSHSDIITGVQFYNDYLISSSNDGRVRLWDLVLANSVIPVDYLNLDNISDGYDSDYNNDESQPDDFDDAYSHNISTSPLVSPSLTNHIDPIELCCEVNFSGHNGPVTCFQAKNDKLLTACFDGNVREFDLETGTQLQFLDLKWLSLSSSSKLSPANLPLSPSNDTADFASSTIVSALESLGPALVTGTYSGLVQLWDLRIGQLGREFNSSQSDITSLSFNDNSIITSSSDGTIKMFDLRNFKELISLGLDSPVSKVYYGTETSDLCLWASCCGGNIVNYNTRSMILSQIDPISGILAETCQVPASISPATRNVQFEQQSRSKYQHYPFTPQTPQTNLNGVTLINKPSNSEYVLSGNYSGNATLWKSISQ